MKILGQIVLYNPDMEVLANNVEHIINQVDALLLVDNNSSDYGAIKKRIEHRYSQVIFIHNEENKGIAYALNQGLEYAKNNDYDWILTMDQDSLFPLGGVKDYKKYISRRNDVGIYCARVVDRSLQELTQNSEEEFIFVDEAITSGSLTNVDIGSRLRYDDWMFIDEVDHEFSWRTLKAGYKIIQINSVVLNHQLGHNGKIKRLFGKDVVIFNHSAFRKYYMVRNQLYFRLKKNENVSLVDVVKKVLKYILIIVLWEDEDKVKKINAVIQGGADFVKYCRRQEK